MSIAASPTTSVAAPPLSLAQAAAQAAAANAVSTASGAGTAAAASAIGTNALQALGSDFNAFLSLLTTQLKNQDPTSPLDTNSFTQELVQFTGVQQSVATNQNLSQLIALQQSDQVLQTTQVVGDRATVTAPQIALQGGNGTITFTAPTAEPVQIAIVNAAGIPVIDATLNAQAGSNTWTWNGKDGNGNQLPDGAYGIALETGNGSTQAALPFSVIGTATGLQNTPNGLQLDIGAVIVPLSSVQSLSH